MLRFALIGALACAALLSDTTSYAQTPQIRGPAARAVTQPRVVLVTPAQRAALASRLAAQPIDPAEITGTVSVNVLSPVVGDPTAPTLALSAYSATMWNTIGPNPQIDLARGPDARVRVTMQLAGGYRYLLVCNMQTRAFEVRDAWNGLVVTWEEANQGAVLIPAEAADRRTYIDLYPTGFAWLRSCEVSRIG